MHGVVPWPSLTLSTSAGASAVGDRTVVLAERVPHPGCTERPEAYHHRTSVDNIGTDTAFDLESSGALGIELPPLARSTTHPGSVDYRERCEPPGVDQLDTNWGHNNKREWVNGESKPTPISEKDTHPPPDSQSKRTKGRAEGGSKSWAIAPANN
ncbi:hypothetical protein NDU88_006256 [Pleurodeles waltl]|uniref:Uncharacterized protein n=1 Tax=Pleurodeles waltl TaxID=8319 RepID=A0AAV7QN20_PLEWA|nr:hypothetical protein NDU88_006256 [Pleurodeles waltl]